MVDIFVSNLFRHVATFTASNAGPSSATSRSSATRSPSAAQIRLFSSKAKAW
jgi:hypothetical protein